MGLRREANKGLAHVGVDLEGDGFCAGSITIYLFFAIFSAPFLDGLDPEGVFDLF